MTWTNVASDDENSGGPPYSNRGAMDTRQSALRACVDWVQVTFKSLHEINDIFCILNMEGCGFSEEINGMYNYKKQVRCGDIRILFEGKSSGMGIHVQMSGQGCRQFEKKGGSWPDFFLKALGSEASFTRLDVAIDDIALEGQKPYFTINRVYRKATSGCVKSRFWKGKYIKSIDFRDGSSVGETMYFGCPDSDVQIRMYEKDYERIEAGEELASDVVAWNRVEVQTRREKAQAVAIYLLTTGNVMEVVQGILADSISFLVKQDGDSNKSRWPMCKWWRRFIDDAAKLKITWAAEEPTIEKKEMWFDKQVTKTLALLESVLGRGYVEKAIREGREKLTDEEERLIQAYKSERHRERRELLGIRDEIREFTPEYVKNQIEGLKRKIKTLTEEYNAGMSIYGNDLHEFLGARDKLYKALWKFEKEYLEGGEGE